MSIRFKKNRLQIIDKGYDQLIKDLKNLKGVPITVGVHSDVGQDTHPRSGETVANIAYKNELGIGVPERSFLRHTADKKKRSWRRYCSQIIGDLVKKKRSLDWFLNNLGDRAKQDVVERIMTIKKPPNNPEYVARYKPLIGNNPLIDTMKLMFSINYKVNKVFKKEGK